MPLSVDLEATIDEICAEVLEPWTPLTDDELLELAGVEDAVRALAGHQTKLRALRIVGDVKEDVAVDRLHHLLALPALADLEVLMLPMCKLGKDGGMALAAAALPKLRLLDVRHTALADVGARALASSKLASSLEHLSIAGAYLSVDGFQALLDSPLGKRKGSLHIEEEGQGESVIPTLMDRLYRLGKGDEAAIERAFARLLEHPALTKETSDELRYQWELVVSN